MLCREECGRADDVLQELNAQVLQVRIPLKVLFYIDFEGNDT